jgi:hypothetical protein
MSNDLVTVIYFWKLKQRKVGFALLRMALDRGALRRINGVHFAKMLGTGKGETFTPRDADANRWGALAVIEQSQLESLDSSSLIKRWRKNSADEVRFLLDPISSHGLWAKTNPFAYSAVQTDGEVIAITRARIKWFQNLRFWRAVPPVTQSLHWQTGAALRNFAYKGAAHQEAIAATERHNWYAEELFARFAVRDIRG